LSKLHVNEINAKGSDNTGLSINDTGRVTTPNKIAFMAVGNAGGAAGAYVSTSPIKPGIVKHNLGSGYNSSTGVFTVPSGGAGLYWFHVHMGILVTQANSGNGYPRLNIYNAANSLQYSPYSYWNHPDQSSYGNASITATWVMEVGGYATVTFHSSNCDYYADGSEVAFQGMLIG